MCLGKPFMTTSAYRYIVLENITGKPNCGMEVLNQSQSIKLKDSQLRESVEIF